MVHDLLFEPSSTIRYSKQSFSDMIKFKIVSCCSLHVKSRALCRRDDDLLQQGV